MLAIIGGSGLYSLGDDFHVAEQLPRATPYGDTSADPLRGGWPQAEVLFLPRHGEGHSLPPHAVNYRANLWALKAAGADRVISVNAVGGIRKDMGPRKLAVPDQLIDYSHGRAHSFFDGRDGIVRHVDFSKPYSDGLRSVLLRAGDRLGIALIDGGTYACTNGPRLETAAEIERLHRDGCSMVGMTGMPEAALARELGLDYASLAVVVNWAAGIGDDEIDMQEIMANLDASIGRLKPLLQAALEAGSS